MESEEFLQSLVKYGATSNNWSLLPSVMAKVNRKTGKATRDEEAWAMLTSTGEKELREKGIWVTALANAICVNPVYARQRAQERSDTPTPIVCTCVDKIERKDSYFSSHSYNGGRHACANSVHKANCALWEPPSASHLHSWRRGYGGKTSSNVPRKKTHKESSPSSSSPETLITTSHSELSIDEREHPRWNTIWAKGVKPRESFDTGCPSPALIQLIDQGEIPNGRALVPGCGRGYDVVALASGLRYTIGVEMSEMAVTAAMAHIHSLPVEHKPASNNFQIKRESFFHLSEAEDDKFDFIYDHTFMCALNPSIREDWAKKMAALLKDGGELLTIIFPIREKRTKVPPYRVSMELYRELLTPLGFEPFRLELLPAELCHPGRNGSIRVRKDGALEGKYVEIKSGIGRWRRTVCDITQAQANENA